MAQAGTLSLLVPRLEGTRNAFRQQKGERYRILFVLGLGLFSWGLIFRGTWRVLGYLEAAPLIGPLVAKNLLVILVLMLLSLVAYSAVISALSTFFLSRDLDLLFPLPVPVLSVFRAKFLEAFAGSSWMVFVFVTPVFVCYGVRLGAPLWYYPMALAVWLAFCSIPVSLGVMLVFILVNVFPARRLRDVLMLLFLVIAAAFVYFIRYLRPERLTSPSERASVQEYIRALEVPGSPLLPSTWASELLAFGAGLPAAESGWLGLYALALLLVPAALYVLAEGLAGRVYFQGWSLTQESKRVDPEGQFHGPQVEALVRRAEFLRLIPDSFRRRLDGVIVLVSRALSVFAPRKARPLLEKDLLVFFRDTAQWPQLVVIGAVVGVYLLNIWALNLQKGVDLPSVRGTISFLNLGMVAFVLTSIALRFAFPAVSIEGEAFWILQTAAMPMRAVVRAKFWTYFPPLLVLSQVLVAASNLLLRVPDYLWWMGPPLAGLFAFSLTGLAVGLGARYPNFRAENVTQVSLSYGGVVFMLTGIGLTAVVMTLLSGPAFLLFRLETRGRVLTSGEWAAVAGAGVIAAAILAASGVFALSRGIRSLERLSG